VHGEAHYGTHTGNKRRGAWILSEGPAEHTTHRISVHINSTPINTNILLGHLIDQINEELKVIIETVRPSASSTTLSLILARRVTVIRTIRRLTRRHGRTVQPNAIGTPGEGERSGRFVRTLRQTVDTDQDVVVRIGNITPFGTQKDPTTAERTARPTVEHEHNLARLGEVKVGGGVNMELSIGPVGTAES